MRHVLVVGSLVWAAVGAAAALYLLTQINSDALLIVGALTILGPLSAVMASSRFARGSDRTAGALLVVSAVTPCIIYPLNALAIVVGLVAVIRPWQKATA